MFLDRSRRGGHHLEWKVRIFSAAAALALIGIYLDQSWLTGAAIVLLLGGVALRFAPSEPGGEEDREAGEGEVEGP